MRPILFSALAAMVVGTLFAAVATDPGREALKAGKYREALDLLGPLARKGDAEAQNMVGVIHLNGDGDLKNYDEARKWFTLAADQKLPKAQYNLGLIHERGLGVPRSSPEAIVWYSRCADLGYVPGQLNLGRIYLSGEGVPKDYTLAMKWYSRAAEQKDAEGQYQLGRIHELGLGTAKNLDMAARLYELSAAQGHKDAAARGAAIKNPAALPKPQPPAQTPTAPR